MLSWLTQVACRLTWVPANPRLPLGIRVAGFGIGLRDFRGMELLGPFFGILVLLCGIRIKATGRGLRDAGSGCGSRAHGTGFGIWVRVFLLRLG